MPDAIGVYIHLRRAKDLIDREYARHLDVPALAREAHASQKLGFEVRTDARMDDFRWVTVSPPGQPDHELILLEPGPPMMDDETAEQVKALVAKGVVGPGAFETDDCSGTYAELHRRGVNFLSQPTERFYGIEATLRDNSGNWFSMTQRSEA